MRRRPTLSRPPSLGGRRQSSGNGKPPALNFSVQPRLNVETPPPRHDGFDNEGAEATSSSEVEIAPATARTNWNVEDGSLRPLPPLHPPLDPVSSAYVSDASPSVIAARVSNCLRERSIMTEFDDDSATASAMTSNRVRFVIRLYRGRSPYNGVIIEVQRLRGDPVSFHQSSRAILSAAQGDHSVMSRPSRRVRESETKTPDGADVLAALETNWSLIRKDRMDANLLGWESLALLTDNQSSTGAVIAARVVLGLNSEDERFAEIHASVMSLVRDHRMLGQATEYASAHGGEEKYNDLYGDYALAEDRDHLIVQRSLAIRAMANSLESLQGRELWEALRRLTVDENIVPALLEEVAQSVLPNNPFNASDATHAARALRVFFTHSSEAVQVANSRNAIALFTKARLVGRSRHAGLERESDRALHALQDFNHRNST